MLIDPTQLDQLRTTTTYRQQRSRSYMMMRRENRRDNLHKITSPQPSTRMQVLFKPVGHPTDVRLLYSMITALKLVLAPELGHRAIRMEQTLRPMHTKSIDIARTPI